MKDFYLWERCARSKFVPQLSRSSLQTEHFKHNMQRMHKRFW
jgi:hypothetical protein